MKWFARMRTRTRRNDAAPLSPSTKPGMGAIPHDHGVSFRVWAPFAEAVAVVGSFNDWSAEADPLAAESGGTWSVDVATAAAGDEYGFAITYEGRELRRADPRARDVVSANGHSVVSDPDDVAPRLGFAMPPWDELVIYEMHVGTFNDIPGGAPGDFATATERLDHLGDLGVNAIELMPTTEFATDYSWGYNPGYPFAIEDAYGGPAGLRAFLDAAHARGIAVILDVVYNHWGPSDNSLWRFDGWSEGDGGGIYFYNDWRRRTPWGDRPDYGRAEVRRYIIDNALMWLEDYGVDGLRWDATAYIRDVDGNDGAPGTALDEGWSLMAEINTEIDHRQPRKVSIAEDLRGNPMLTTHVDMGGAGFDSQWDAGFVHPVRAALTGVADEWRSMHDVALAVGDVSAAGLRRVVYTESHDEVANGRSRVPSEIDPMEPESWHAKKRSTLGAALVFTSPGIPMIFQGQELLEDRWFHDQDPIEWSRLERLPGIVTLYRDLVALRRNLRGTTAGLRGSNVGVHHVNEVDKVLGYHRWDRGGPGDDVVVLANFANRTHDSYTVGMPRPGAWRLRFNSDWSGYDPSFGNHPSFDTVAHPDGYDGMPSSAAIGIGPYTVLVLSQDQ
jgi:1,4-alpha-glucan branching enzyme